MASPSSSPIQTYAPSPFDAHAANYAASWGQDPVAAHMRRVVYACAESAFPAGSRVLDAGCGAGIDAAWLLGRGHRVVAIDASAGMVAAARARAPGADVHQRPVEEAAALAAEGPFDGALLNFGVLNCVSLPAAAAALAAALRPGAPLIAVPMPRFSPSWTLSRLARGQPREALRRLRSELDVVVEGAPVRTRYLGLSTLRSAFSPCFELERAAALGLLLPPPGTTWPSARLDRLARLEDRVRHLPVLRGWGDHLLVLLRRTTAPPG